MPPAQPRRVLETALWALLLASCARTEGRETRDDAGPVSVASARPPEPAPELLYLPDSGDLGPPRSPGQGVLPGPWGFASKRCPEEMVDVQGRFCVDRFEATLVDRERGREISPFYHPARMQSRREYGKWQRARLESESALSREMAVPAPPSWQLAEEVEPRAEVKPGVVPNGFVSGDAAAKSCQNAGKRLCTQEEWVTACRGEKNRKYPYGERYAQGRCNVFRESHPALVLHGNPSINHLDPRLLKVKSKGKPLLMKTGETPDCKSEWGSDAIFDMVGNLDEWVDEPKGRFSGGFFSRSTREGCDASVTAHPRAYYDYSLGVRCCK